MTRTSQSPTPGSLPPARHTTQTLKGLVNTVNTEKLKKDFQKTVKNFRDTLPDVLNYQKCEQRPDYPKAMMTSQQMMKGTATVNFGSNSEGHENNLVAFIETDAFKKFCEENCVQVVGREVQRDDCLWLRLKY
ncbi:MAG: hypothetical protein LLF96_03480 [Eubacteriales bacterium]|nr:hypothetical protein [Eubacteriales bacterium]